MLSLYERLDRFLTHEADVAAMMEVLGVFETDVAETFLELGFRPHTARAIEMAPLVYVAWASNKVTDSECTAATAEVYDSLLRDFPATMSIFHRWMTARPQPGTWDLWVKYTQCRLESMSAADQAELHSTILRQAKRIARASGGWMGIGSICREEQEVIDAIDRVFVTESMKSNSADVTLVGARTG